jgi:hypothetical protein
MVLKELQTLPGCQREHPANERQIDPVLAVRLLLRGSRLLVPTGPT